MRVTAGDPWEGGRHFSGIRRRLTRGERDEARQGTSAEGRFPIKDLGELSYYFGYHVTRDRKVETLKCDHVSSCKRWQNA